MTGAADSPMQPISYTPIGIIHTPFTRTEHTPVQAALAGDISGRVEVFEAFRDGLQDLEGFSHIMLLYAFDRSSGYRLRCQPFFDTVERGVFATRSPRRPNPIGVSVVELRRVSGAELMIAGVDMLDGSPLLDIKPYIADFDARHPDRQGWYADAQTVAGRPILE